MAQAPSPNINYMNCLKYAVGLSRTNCNCFTSGQPSDFSTSESTLYLDETPGLKLKMVESAEDCEEGSVWDMLQEAREEGIKHFVSDLLRALQEDNALRLHPWQGCVGGTKFTKNLSFNGTYGGLKVKTNNQKGGIWKITKIGVMLGQTTTYTLSIYNNVQSAPVAQYLLSGTADTLVENVLPAPLELPLWSQYEKKLEYYFVYDNTITVKNNSFDCGCSSKQENPYEVFAVASGIKGNNIATATSWANTASAHGLTICGEFLCKTQEVICTASEKLDYLNDAVAMQFATGLRYKQAEVLIEKILATGNLNRYSMLERETMWGKRNHYRSMAEKIILGEEGKKGLAELWNILRNECLVCVDERIKKITIMT